MCLLDFEDICTQLWNISIQFQAVNPTPQNSTLTDTHYPDIAITTHMR